MSRQLHCSADNSRGQTNLRELMLRDPAREDRGRPAIHQRAKRRRGIPKAGARLLLSALLVAVGYSALVEPRLMTVTEHEVSISGLPSAFDGLKIVQLSDLHVDIWTRPRHIRRIVRRVNTMRPDVIVLTGDYVSRTEANIGPAGDALAGLKSKYGAYAVLGNHDYWTDAKLMARALRESGIDVLFDEKRRISIGRSSIWLVGFDDEWEGNPDYEKALNGISSNDICIAIAHNPDAVLSLDGRPVNLLLTGHTHGGLINIPGVGPLWSTTKLGPKYSSGLFRFGDTRMYVCRGIGTGTGYHIRFRCPPEISVFTLRRAEPSGRIPPSCFGKACPEFVEGGAGG